jgi:1,4-alpha-glucan branching enzyme
MTATLTKKKNSNSSCGVRQYKDGVTFTALFQDAKVVQLAGDFNNWRPEQTPMKKSQKNGFWKVKLPLDAGTYRYRLVVDGCWQHDPCNEATENNPYGELNSVVRVS